MMPSLLPARLWARSALTLALVLCLLLPSLAVAEEAPWDLTEEELEAEGWEARKQHRAPGSVGCGLWSILISTVYHGWGHRCAEDQETHIELLVLEGVAIGLIATATTIAVLSNDADTLNPVWSTLFYLGSMSYFGGYLFDVMGTFKGDARSFSTNRRNIQGIAPRLIVRLVSDDPFDFQIVYGLEVPFNFERFWFSPRYLTEGGGYNQLAADTGVRLWIGDDPDTYWAISAETRYEDFPQMGFSVLTAVPKIEHSLDMGAWIPHLAEVRLINRLGYGFEFYHWESLESDEFFKDTTSLLVLETELSVNIHEDLNFALLYKKRPDLLLGGLSRSGEIFGVIPHAGFGIVGLNLDFVTESGWLANLEANVGTLIEVWLGFGRRF